ncbi:hypothetical protein ACEPT7_03435 [Burkholderia ubonensis]|uniref:endo-beta-N-acetylglucosaminidase n=1 Tax=Burkholderia ubonensis TaxID=101571 RepID=UPI00358EFE46
MKRHKSLLIIIAAILSSNTYALDTYTWTIDNNKNSSGYNNFKDLDVGNLTQYPAPSTTALNRNLTRKWLGTNTEPASGGLSFVALYRTRPSTKTYSLPPDGISPVNFENWAFIRKFIAFGGDTEKGAHITAPDPEWVTAAHRNGVKIYGTVFIYQDASDTQVKNLLGNFDGSKSETDQSAYDIPAIRKLESLAEKLKLDGWFLNIEKGIDGQSTNWTQNRIQLNRLVRNVFSASTVEFITYTGSSSNGITETQSAPVINDDSISDFDVRPTDHPALDNAAGIDPEWVATRVMPPNSHKQYLMFLDGPFSRNTALNEIWPKRINSAKSSVCQYFNGVSGTSWNGLKNFTAAVYPVGINEKQVICGGNNISLQSPAQVAILKITLPAAMTVTYTRNNDNVTCTGSSSPCLIEMAPASNLRITFNYPISSIKTNYLPNDNYSYANDSLYAQIMPGFKWWNKITTEPGNFVWSYTYTTRENNKSVVKQNPAVGSYCVTDNSDRFSCNISLYPASTDYMNYSDNYGPYLHDGFTNFGNFPALNYVMNVTFR